MMTRIWPRIILMVLVMALGFGMATTAYADEQPAPIYLNPDGTLREEVPAVEIDPVAEEGSLAPGGRSEPVTNVEGEAPQPNTRNRDFNIFVSAPGNGTIGNLSYADEDIMRYDTKLRQWFKVFDGTDAGLPASADIDALAYVPINLGHIFYMSFDTPVAVPGLGTVDDSDVVAYRYVFGQSGSWSLYFRGSQNGLTTDAEDIDAIEIDGNALYISTLGNFKVPKLGGGTLTGGSEDVFAYYSTQKAYGMKIDGTQIGLATDNNIRGYAYIRYNDYEWHFLSLQRPAGLKYAGSPYPALNVKANDISVYEAPLISGARAFGHIWSAGGTGFPKVDAIDVVLR